MPFYNDLDTVCMDLYGQGIEPLLDASRHKDVVSALLRPEGLNYGQLPRVVAFS